MVKHILGQTVLRDSPSQHSARGGKRFVYSDCKPAVGKVVCKSKSRRAGADYRNLLRISSGSLFLRERQFARFDHFHFLVGSESFEEPDGHRVIKVFACAGVFTGMCADTAANRR